MASILSVAGGAAQAANTAAEEFGVDTNADGVKDAREFAGAHRYATAEKLARRFASDSNGVSSLIVASGESEVDAVTAAGLAGSMNAPVLLTRQAMLPHGVSRFINDNNVTSVTIVGGTAAVSDAVKTQIEALGSKPKVTRIAGANRYATAAMIGASLGGSSPTWCGAAGRAAILVNGSAANRSDAIVAGPLANRLGLPMLLTEADELPAVTRKFLVDNRVERVVVVGNSEAVSGALINTLVEDVGVTDAPRISGDTAAATSVAVAEEMRDACKDVLSTDLDRVALVNQTATADGIAASPVLGRGLGTTGSIPILLVGDSLPAEVSEFLGKTPNVRAGNKTDLKIVAVGGTAVVSSAVMDAAVEAATTGGELTAKISFDPGTSALSKRQFTVTFSDVVDTRPFPANKNSVLNPGLYRVNGRRLSAATPNTSDTDPDEGVRRSSSLLLTGNTVTVTLGASNADTTAQLKTGDKIEVAGGGTVGAAGDKRKLKTASLTISAPAAATDDTTAPVVVEILAVAGQGWFDVIVREPKPLLTPGGDPYRLDSGVDILKCSACEVSARVSGLLHFNRNDAQLGRPGSDGNGGGLIRYTFNVGDRPGGPTVNRLQAGDIIEVKRGTFLNSDNRGNRLTRHTVAAATADTRVTGIFIGPKYPTKAASGNISLGASGVRDDIKVTAKQTGIAAGTAGNNWDIFGYQLPTASNTKPVEIEVAVDDKNKIISYTVRNGLPKATVGDLAAALNGDETFAANFTVDFADPTASQRNPGALLTSIDPAKVDLTGGKSAVGLRVDFSNAVLDIRPSLGSADHVVNAVWGAAVPSGVKSAIRFGDRRGWADRSLWISFESAELAGTTKLPTRSSTRNIGGSSKVISYFGSAPARNLKGSFIRNFRPDASLIPFDLGTDSLLVRSPQAG